MAHLRKMRRVEMEVNVVEDGGWINWAEQGNTGMYFKRLVKVERRKDMKVSVRKRLDVRGIVKSETTYPYEMKLGSYLVVKEGEAGMKRLCKLGVKTPEKLEELYVEQIVLREPGVCANPNKEFQKFDVEALSDEAVKRLISRWESGIKIEARQNPGYGRTNYYVRLLGMSPGQGDPTRPVKEKQHEQTRDDGKTRPEVNRFQTAFE